MNSVTPRNRRRRIQLGSRSQPRRVLRSLLICIVLALSLSHCGFFAQPRVSEAYLENFAPEDEVECLVTWPIHAIALPVTATIDQGARTVEATVPAGRDAWDFVLLQFSDDNIMLSRTLAVPKLLITPGIFVGSYLTRWFYPLDDDDRPFGEYDYQEGDQPGENEEHRYEGYDAETDPYDQGDSSREEGPPSEKASPPPDPDEAPGRSEVEAVEKAADSSAEASRDN